ncbi:MAG TPA: carbohydrate kinase family protein [Anaerolineae bacterium]|nr:carbohydrate kinase family protein [Anaerolineae bacterium]
MVFEHNIQVVIAGMLQRETIINVKKDIHIDQPGGNLLYTAACYKIWHSGVGLVSRISEDFPQEWLEQFQRIGLDTRGIKRSSQKINDCRFYAFLDEDKYEINNPVRHFSKMNRKLPKNLLGYASPQPQLDSKDSPTAYTIFPDQIPPQYKHATSAYLGPIDFLSHRMLIPELRSGLIGTIILNPSPNYMNPAFWYSAPSLFQGIEVVITNATKAKKLFLGKSKNLVEIAETIGKFGVQIVILTNGKDGQILFDAQSGKKWRIPAYPVKAIDTIGACDAFCGGFLASYLQHFDPLRASLYGNIAASIKIENSGPFYVLETLPELLKARIDVLKDKFTQI